MRMVTTMLGPGADEAQADQLHVDVARREQAIVTASANDAPWTPG
jgi:hypothetical protein